MPAQRRGSRPGVQVEPGRQADVDRPLVGRGDVRDRAARPAARRRAPPTAAARRYAGWWPRAAATPLPVGVDVARAGVVSVTISRQRSIRTSWSEPCAAPRVRPVEGVHQVDVARRPLPHLLHHRDRRSRSTVPVRNICGCSVKPALPVAAERLGVRRRREHRRAGSRGRGGSPPPAAAGRCPGPAAPGGRRRCRGIHISSRVSEVAKPSIPVVVLGHPAAAGVGLQEVAAASQPRLGPRRRREARGPVGPRAGAHVELVEALVAQPLGGGSRSGRIGRIVTVTRPAATESLARDRMRVHARAHRPGQVRRHPHRGPGGRGDRRGVAPDAHRTTSSTWRRCPTADPASSTCCTRRSGASCSPSRSAARTARPVPATILLRRGDGVRRERPGVRPAPDRRRGRRARRRRTASGELLLAAVDAGAATVVVGLGGSGTQRRRSGAAGRARGHRRRAAGRRARPGSTAITAVDLAAARERVGRVGWWRPATWTTR